MKKIRIISHTSSKEEVIETLQKAGVVEFTEVTEESLTKSEPKDFNLEHKSAGLDFAVEFLSQFYSPSDKLRNAIEGGRVRTNEEKLKELSEGFNSDKLIQESEDLQREINNTQTSLKDKEHEIESLAPWIDASIPLDSETESDLTKVLFVVGDESKEKRSLANQFKYEFSTEKKYIYQLHEVSKKAFYVILFKKQQEEALGVIKNINANVVTLPPSTSIPKKRIEQLEKEIKNAKVELEKLQKKGQVLSRNLPALKQLSDQLLWKKEQHSLLKTAKETKETVVLEGWIPKEALMGVRDIMDDKNLLVTIESIEPNDGEEEPIEIKNNRFVRPFEAITRLYGVPAKNNIDPTPYLAGFFFVFFGLCLTDVGYGLVLMLLTGILLWKYHLLSGVKILMQLLFIGGLSSFLAGILFGGYLGIDPSMIPEPLLALQKFDPLLNPLPVFYLSLGLGVIQVLFGLMLNIARHATLGSLKEGVLDSGPWILLLLSLILFGANVLGYLPESIGSYTSYMIYASLGAIILTGGRTYKGIIQKCLMGIVALYDSIGYFSDILSYSRLLALGLATSALAFAVNLIAQLIGDMIPVVGSIVAILILIGGHIFNVAVNTLGSFIHSARLQFVEFFGKFVVGTGKPFEPFKRQERYSILEE